MFASSPTQSSNSPNGTGQSSRARILQQPFLDAVLDANYEGHGDCFDYKLFESQRLASNQQHSEKVIPYLQELKKGNLIQPFGCLLALDARTLKVIAFSENAPEMLTAIGHADDSPNLCIGTNIVTLFAEPSATTLNMVLGHVDASSLKPIIVQCKASGEPFYAIVRQAIGCLVVDFEPVNPSEFPTAVAWASQSYKLAATAISKIQSLPGGSMQVLCNTLVHEVFDLMGYDRVMVYKFHEDFHGEVIAEMTKPGLEPYLGLHYPATDIPQAARLLFMKNKVCMITDCHMRPVKIIEDEELPFHVSLCGSALRAPHSCHLQYMENMKSVASLVMAVVVNEDGEHFEVTTEEQTQKNQRKKLWGLIVCHHGSSRYVPFPLRHACEFTGHVFAIHVSKEIELEKRMQEKSILCMQSMLSSMMFRQPCPLSIWEVSDNDSNLLTPMFGADQSGKCSEWNAAMAMLTGWHREEVLHKMLLEEVFDNSNTPCIMLKDKDAYVSICILINSILVSDKTENHAPFGFFDRNRRYIECMLSAKRKQNADGILIGVSFILFPSHEQQYTLQVQQACEKTTLERSRYLDILMDEFVLQDMVVAAISKVQTACQGKGIIVSCDLAEKFLKQRLYGDCIQLQKILSDFLFASVKFCPIGGSVTISSNLTKNSIGENIDLIDLELRIKEQVIVFPEEILAHMFQEGHGHQLEQGLTLVVCRNLLSLMN